MLLLPRHSLRPNTSFLDKHHLVRLHLLYKDFHADPVNMPEKKAA